MNPHVFREYDVRGVVDQDLNEDFIVDLGRAIGTYALQNKVQVMTVGRDCRLSSADYQRYLIRGLNAAGIDTIDIGLCATPMLYFAIRHCDAGGGVMITGSHNPPEFNGFKICVGYDSIYGPQIQELRKIMEADAYASGSGKAQSRDIALAYSNYLFDNVRLSKKNERRSRCRQRRRREIRPAPSGTDGLRGHLYLLRSGRPLPEPFSRPDG